MASSRGVIGTAWVSDRSVYGDRRNETRIQPEFVVRTALAEPRARCICQLENRDVDV